MINPEQSRRWYAPKDPLCPSDICQAGATGIGIALAAVPNKETWAKEAMPDRERIIKGNHSLILSKASELHWSVIVLQVLFFTFFMQSIAHRQQRNLLVTASGSTIGLLLQSKYLSQLPLNAHLKQKCIMGCIVK